MEEKNVFKQPRAKAKHACTMPRQEKGRMKSNIHSNKPRLVGGIVAEMLQRWHRNTELSVDLKTILRSDRRLQPGKDYHGILRRDVDSEEFRYDEHFTFVETLPWTTKRNPHVFRGKYISITRRDDGSLRLNFRPLKIDADFGVYRYALGVFNELLWALEGLVEK